MRSLPLLFVLVIAVGGFTYFGSETVRTLPKAGQYDRYFATPKASVETVTQLLDFAMGGILVHPQNSFMKTVH